MKLRRVLFFAITAAVVSVAWMSVGIPTSSASPGLEADVEDTELVGAMHAACATGNVDAMTGIMESLTEEDWGAMGSGHMGSGHMGSGMMDSGQMGSDQMDSGMMGSTIHETADMDGLRW